MGTQAIAMPRGEYGEVGFTEEDRKSLITLEANYLHLEKLLLSFRDTMERRLERLEDERAYKIEVSRLEGAHEEAVKSLTHAVARLQSKVTWAYAFAAGIACAASAIAALVAEVIRTH